MAIYLIEITAYDPGLPGTTTLRYATGAGIVTGPGETPANTIYEPRVIQPGNFEVNLFAPGTTQGRSTVGFGVVQLANADGGLDDLIDYGFDGREIVIRRGDDDATAYPANYPAIFTGTMERAEFAYDTVTIRIRDRLAEVADKPLQTTKFAGSNSLPAGVEGVEDIKGKPKPVLYGKALNFSPPLVNTSKLIYQLADKAVQSIEAVYDRGATITAGSSRADVATLESTTPTAGTYDWTFTSSGSYIRLGSTPAGQVTTDATEGATSADRTAAQVAKRILTDRGGVSSGDVDSASVTALDSAANYVLGFWTGDEMTCGEALDRVLGSVGGYWAVQPDGDFVVGVLSAPSGSDAFALESWQLIEEGSAAIELQSGNDDTRGLPANRVVLSYAPNFTVQQPSDLSGVALTRANVVREPYLKVASPTAGPSSTVLTAHPLSKEIEIETLLASSGNAQTVADDIFDLRSVRRDVVRVRCKFSEVSTLTLGSVGSIEIARFGWDSGQQFVLIGQAFDYARDMITLTLWG